MTIFSFYHNLVYCIQDCEREGTWTIDKKRKLVSGKLLFRSQERTKNIIYINDINHYSYFVLDKKVSTLLLKESFSQIHWFLTKTHSSINVRNWLYQNTYIYCKARRVDPFRLSVQSAFDPSSNIFENLFFSSLFSCGILFVFRTQNIKCLFAIWHCIDNHPIKYFWISKKCMK